MRFFNRTKMELWRAMRVRMLRETETFLEHGLEHPEQHLRIPSKPVGTGGFPKEMSEAFWSQVLATS